MVNPNLPERIVEEFGLPEHAKRSIIAKQTIVDWMASDDLEALGALYSFLVESRYAARIKPALTFADYWRFISRYFERCLREDPSGEWAHSRYETGWDLASWFAKIWEDSSVSLEEKADIKAWLATQYRSGNSEVRRAIVDATLEHLFENREIERFFEDWKDGDLSIAYTEAAQWSAKGGQSGIVT